MQPAASRLSPWPWTALTATVGALVVYAALAAAGWPGAASPCLAGAPCWCETPIPGWVREPWNTASNLPVFAASIWVGWLAGRATGAREVAILRVFSYALWVQAAGAMFFHGALTAWSQSADRTSILMVWGAILCTSLVRLGVLSVARLPLAVGATSAAALLYVVGLGLDVNVGGLTCLGTFFALEILLATRPGRPASPVYFRAAVGLFVVSLLAWAMSIPGSPLCDAPVSPHAVWHLAVGGAVTCLARHAASWRAGSG